MVDGQQQRRALTAAEQALHALDAGDGTKATDAALQAAELDQVGLFVALPGVVEAAAAEVEMNGAVTPASWQVIADVLGSGPLAAFASERAGANG